MLFYPCTKPVLLNELETRTASLPRNSRAWWLTSQRDGVVAMQELAPVCELSEATLGNGLKMAFAPHIHAIQINRRPLFTKIVGLWLVYGDAAAHSDHYIVQPRVLAKSYSG